jgi:hypothetical protein
MAKRGEAEKEASMKTAYVDPQPAATEAAAA